MFNAFEKKIKEIFLDEKKIIQKNAYELLRGVKVIILEHFSKISDEVNYKNLFIYFEFF